MVASVTMVIGRPALVEPGRGRVGLDHAAGAFAVDDPHHDGPGVRAGELGPHRHAPGPAQPEGHVDHQPRRRPRPCRRPPGARTRTGGTRTRATGRAGWRSRPRGSQVPGSTITALTEPSSGGRGRVRGPVGRTSRRSVASRTQISTPSSQRRGTGSRSGRPSTVSARPCQRQYMVPSSTGQRVHQRTEVRAGAGSGDERPVGVAPEDHLAAGDRPGHRLGRADVGALRRRRTSRRSSGPATPPGGGDPTRLGLPPGRRSSGSPAAAAPVGSGSATGPARAAVPSDLSRPAGRPETQRHGCPFWRGRADLAWSSSRSVEPGQAALRIRGPVTMIRPAVSALRAVGTRARPLNTL